ncbi:hypothetical protein V6O07_03865, partial [Arthrospira platensis SPKY2]
DEFHVSRGALSGTAQEPVQVVRPSAKADLATDELGAGWVKNHRFVGRCNGQVNTDDTLGHEGLLFLLERSLCFKEAVSKR